MSRFIHKIDRDITPSTTGKQSMSAPRVLLAIVLFINFSYPLAYAGTLEFQGVPVDITTSDGEDLLIVPGTGGNIQIGDGIGTNTYAITNDDLHITGALQVNGDVYFDDALFAGATNFQVDADGDITKIKSISYSWPSAQGGVGTFLKNDG